MSPYNKLYTKTAFKNVPFLGAQDGKGDDTIAYVKFFCPLNGWKWYVTEYDPQTGQAFGLIQGYENEFGYFPIHNTEQADWMGEALQSQNDNWKGRYRMPPIERDSSFKPTTLKAIAETP